MALAVASEMLPQMGAIITFKHNQLTLSLPSKKVLPSFHMSQQKLAILFFKELTKCHQVEHPKARAESLYQLLCLIFQEITKEEKVSFTTLFARMAFAFQKVKIYGRGAFPLHQFRKKMTEAKSGNVESPDWENIALLGEKSIGEGIMGLLGASMPADVVEWIPKTTIYEYKEIKIKQFYRKVRVVVLADDIEASQLICQAENAPGIQLRVQYGIADRNENFNKTIKELRSAFDLPINVNLIDVEVDENNVFRPAGLVVMPDFLMNVTDVAEIFNPDGTEPVMYLLKKYMPFESNMYMMIGNIANFFLDELMSNPEATFKEIFPKVFQLNPLAFALFDDRIVRTIYDKSKLHYVNLKKMVVQDFEAQGIVPKDCNLEPSFYSEMYGIQGRLDVFYKNGDNSAIVELKSGKPYKPNRYQINHNHYTQTLLYDLMVQPIFDFKIRPANYILYSQDSLKPLRFAPTIKAQQYEAIQLRNQLLALNKRLAKMPASGEVKLQQDIFRLIRPDRFPKVKGFGAQDIVRFEAAYSNLTDIERQYFIAFSGFIAREHLLAKTGVQDQQKLNGQARLWLNETNEKDEQFEVLQRLKVLENESQADDPYLIFQKTAQTNPLANFRVGDIAVLYPADRSNDSVLTNQIFKINIVEINSATIKVSLRYKQFNSAIFDEYEHWNLEHDLMEIGFNSMYKALFAFAELSDEQRGRLLTTYPPKTPDTVSQDIVPPPGMTEEQEGLFKEIIQAKDYYLLWGPPGTGKTSVMLKGVVEWLYHQTEENILLLAYTNRAVDEICDAIESIGDFIRDDYIRIGSRYSTQDRFKPQLLDTKIAKITNRKELKGIIEGHRIFVGTLASFSGKKDLLKLKHFNRVIIDEASQILEPNLIGLLPSFDQFVLIGDHKQLPAVVTQSKEVSEVESLPLRELGLFNLRNSLFERLYHRCQQMNWHWAYGQLSHQGRMHQDIMQFPNEQFYDGQLKILPDTVPFSAQQKQSLDAFTLEDDFAQKVLSNRMVYINTPADPNLNQLKTNEAEAQKVAELVTLFKSQYEAANKPFEKRTLGVITPYRAQIAQIAQSLESAGLAELPITIDTVERYQGGARDIIILSLCTNSIHQLASLVSHSDDGTDRKLNVALTRARKHLIMIGNEEILELDAVYQRLIERVARVG